ncbi:MAG: universal stress protein [Prevotellaceae bacterium]|jgi:nucleotide-binding universal stress UspA family protein|nr:universal stress protein [Prevotellaceae bacterium]
MEEKLVTVAIHTFGRAQILKTLLEREGIETYIQDVDPLAPAVSAGVRVRINDKDLPRALKVIEEMNAALEKETDDEKPKKQKKILVPIDFSEHSKKACELSFHLAATMKAEITILHTYFSPIYTGMPIGETLTYEMNEEETLIKVIRKVKAEVDTYEKDLHAKITEGKLPVIKFKMEMREGVPEEEIIRFAQQEEPVLIVMGTRGKHQKESDLIGSVTAEVIERSRVPVLAIPEGTSLTDWDKLKNIAYATNFDQKDLLAFEKLTQLLEPFAYKVHLVHISANAENSWNEIKLEGIKAYFKKHYPKIKTEYAIIQSDDIATSLDEYIHKNDINILSLTTHKRNIFTRLFNPSIARKMIFHTDTPMFVFHS